MKPKRRRAGAEIRKHLLAEISRRSVNDQLPPEVQLAKEFGVNRLTVNKVMTELQREGYVQRIRGKGTFITAPEKHVHTELRSRRTTGQIVIAYPDYYSFDLWSKVNCAEDLAHRNDVELVNIKMNKGMAYESVVAMIRERGHDVKGAIIAAPISDPKSIAMLDSLGISVVILAACERPALSENVVCVHRDYYREGYLAMSRLMAAGHQRLAYVANEPWNLSSKLQFQGVKAALYEHGLNLKDLTRSPNGIPPWESSIVAGYQFTAEMIKKATVTGIMYRSTPGALGGIRAVAEAGLKTPEDISMIAGGEGSPLDDYLVPAVTNVACEYRAWVTVAFDVILNRARRHEKQIVVDVRLVERKSIMPPSGGRRAR